MAPINRTVNLSIDIDCPPAKAFAAICDLSSYNTWLSRSGVFKGTTKISDSPVKVGTKYTEHSPTGTRYGEVVELDGPHRHVVFRQPHTLTPAILRLKIDIVVDMVVNEREGGLATLNREVRLGIPVALGLAAGYIESLFRTESLRTMEQLQVFFGGGRTLSFGYFTAVVAEACFNGARAISIDRLLPQGLLRNHAVTGLVSHEEGFDVS